MTPTEKRILKQKIQCAVITTIIDMTDNDAEFFLGLLYASEEINNSLAGFADMMDEEDSDIYEMEKEFDSHITELSFEED